MRIAAPTDPEGQRPFAPRRALGLALCFAVLALIAWGWYWYARREREQAVAVWRARLTAMADDRQAALEAWIKERWGDGHVIASFPTVQALLAGRADNAKAEEAHLGTIFAAIGAQYGYLGVTLLDAEGRPVAAAPGSPPPTPEVLAAARHTTGLQAQSTLLYRGARSGALRLAFLVPVPAGRGYTAPELGYVWLVQDPARWLFPLFEREPVPTLTGETVLAQAEDGKVLFISPLRFKPAEPLSFRLPLNTMNLAERAAVLGRKTFGEFTDYRGTPVFAATRPIKGTDWGLVVKVDRSEALAPYHRDMIQQGLLLLAVLITLTGAGYGLWRRQRVRGLHAVLAERERSEGRIRQLNRLLRTISEINQLIVREQDRDRLLSGACRILVELGMFRMAWFGFKDEPAGTVAPSASSEGARGYLQGVTVRWDDSPAGRGPTGTAIRENRHVLNLDVTTNPVMAPWREAALRAGYRSSAAFPLRVHEAVLGALTVYADRPHAFGDEEVALLDELAGDLGYALEVMEDRAERLRAGQALRESEERFSLFMENLPAMAFIKDSESRNLFMSRSLSTALGKEPAELTGRGPEDLYGKELGTTLRANDAETLSRGVPSRWREKALIAGEERLFDSVKFPIPTPNGTLLGGIAMDVTARVRAEEALREAHERLRRFVDSNIVGVVIATAQGRILEANDYYLDLIGFSREELEGGEMDGRAITPSEWLPADESALAELRERGRCAPYEKEYVRRDGSRVPVYLVDAMLPGQEREIAVFILDLSEQKRAEAARRESEERFRLFMQAIPARVFIKDAESRYLYLNDYMASTLDRTVEESSGRTPEELYGAEAGAALRGHDTEALSKREPTRWEEELPLHGHQRLFSSIKFPIPSPSGTLLGGVSLDVTDRLRAEQALAESERRLSLALEATNIGLWDWDLKSDRWYSTPTYFRMLGYEPESEGQNREVWGERTHPEDRPFVIAKMDEVRDQGLPGFDITFRFRHADGSYRWVNSIGRAVEFGEGGKSVRLLGLQIDVTEKVRAEEEIRLLNERLRLLAVAVQELAAARGLPDVTEVVRRTARWLVGADGVTFVLRDGDQCHYVEEDAIGPLWKGMRFPLEECISGWAMLHGEAAVIEDIYADPRIPHDAYRSTFVQSLAMVPIRREEPIGAIGAYWAERRRPTDDEVAILQALADATSRAIESVRLYEELERRVQERTAELNASNKELESFSYSVSHDLRAPLRAIDGFSRAVDEDYGERLDDEGRRLLGIIRSSTRQMAQLIDDLLDFSRAGRHELRRGPVDMTALARLAFEGLAGAQPGPGLTFHLAPLEDATGDPSLLKQIWVNLMSNALKFSAGRTPSVIEVGGRRDGAQLVYWVRDNGVGFDDRYAHKLFGVFQRLHAAGEFPGTGVGLAIVKRIVTRHGGRVWAESRLEEGATFFFSLPEAKGEFDEGL